MAIRLFVAGERPSAADVNRYFMQQHVSRKTANESVTSSTVLQDDDHLTAPIVANSVYWVWCVIFYTGPSTGAAGADLLMDWDGPTGTTFEWYYDGLSSDVTSSISVLSRKLQSITDTPAIGTVNTVDTTVFVKGVVRCGSTSGNFRLQWAQAVSNATPVTLYTDSTLIIRRLID